MYNYMKYCHLQVDKPNMIVNKNWLNPFGMVDGYSSSLRDATGPVDEYSHKPTSTQVTYIVA